jgi:hypothetical protein
VAIEDSTLQLTATTHDYVVPQLGRADRICLAWSVSRVQPRHNCKNLSIPNYGLITEASNGGTGFQMRHLLIKIVPVGNVRLGPLVAGTRLRIDQRPGLAGLPWSRISPILLNRALPQEP